MSKSKDEFWSEGYAAGLRFGLYDEPAFCPYDEGTVGHREWTKGYQDGYLDS